jgi:hypothetical protein
VGYAGLFEEWHESDFTKKDVRETDVMWFTPGKTERESGMFGALSMKLNKVLWIG